ncbi:hypothetical protein PFISCL1PPCAC_3789, partial [Pristionchus fissidentatus]
EKDADGVLNELHNRELDFYRWFKDAETDPNQTLKLPLFHGGEPCTETVGMIVLEDFTGITRICNDADYLSGFGMKLALDVVRQLAAIQCAYLSSDRELTNNIYRIDFSAPVHNCIKNIHKVDGLTEEMKSKLLEWVDPVTLFNIHADVPVEGISPTLIHCDLWPGNLLFHKEGTELGLLSIIDWQCFKIGNPLLDVASVIGESMNAVDRRAHKDVVLQAYVDEMSKGRSRFKRPFDMTIEKARILLSHALKWPCVQLMFAVVTTTEEEHAANSEESRVYEERLRELLVDTI